MYRGTKGRDSDMNDTAALVSLATSIPPYQFHQKQILEAARDVLADRYPQFETLSSLFANTGIRHRYGVKPIEWYLERRGWPERTTGFPGRRRKAVHRRRAQGDRACRSLGRRYRHRRHGVFDRHRDADAGGARRRQARLARRTCRACRCSVWAAPAACRGCRSPRAWRRRGPAPTCCWSRSNSARSRCATTN